ncbi:MAG: hypothetical protein VB859_14065 [Planctomycetaceae bacterium]
MTSSPFPRVSRWGGCLLLLLAAGSLPAQSRDQVVFRQPDGRGRMARTGTIIEYDAVELVLKSRIGGRIWKIPAARIVSVNNARTPSHDEALKRLERGEIPEARSAFRLALDEASRRWVRGELLAGLVRCALHEGDYQRAGSQFLNLCDSTPRSRHFELAPLDWYVGGTTAAAVAGEARAWRGRKGDVARLLAASHLLRDRTFGAEAENEIRRLRISTDFRVRGLAIAQSWRIELRRGEVSAARLDEWLRQARGLPGSQRGGPWFVIGLARVKRRRFQSAASAFLWTSLVFRNDHHLAARATQHAADALLADNQTSAARTLYRDLARRFPGTPAAREAAPREDPPRRRRTSP